MGWGRLGSIFGRVKGSALVLFLFYVNVFRMGLFSRFSSHPLTITAPWVLLRVRWSIPHGVTTSSSLAGNREAELNKTNHFLFPPTSP